MSETSTATNTASGTPTDPTARNLLTVQSECQTCRIESESIDSVRIDQWMHAVRITMARSDAAACRGGHVSIRGRGR